MIRANFDPNFKIENGALAHSYQIHPPKYSEPQLLYTFYYEGFLKGSNRETTYNWTIDPPFYILSGQGTSIITLELLPKLNKDQEPIITKNNIKYRDYKYSNLNLQMGNWKESRNLYYKQGPLWKIEGNKNPKINTKETYKITPQYNQIGNPPKNSTNFNFYNLDVKNGKVNSFHGGVPPYGTPLVDITWYQTGPAYLSFYSSWNNEPTLFPNTLDIYVSE